MKSGTQSMRYKLEKCLSWFEKYIKTTYNNIDIQNISLLSVSFADSYNLVKIYLENENHFRFL